MRNQSLVMLLCVGACATPDPNSALHRSLELEVHSALLAAQFLTVTDSQAKLAEVLLTNHSVRFDTTFWEERRRWLRDSVPDLPLSAVSDFRRLAQDTAALERIPTIGQPIRLLADTTLRRFFSRENWSTQGWNGFRAAFPNGGPIVSLSRVGLSRDHAWAIVYGGSQGDWLAGAGYLFVFRKDGGQWRVRKQLVMWVS